MKLLYISLMFLLAVNFLEAKQYKPYILASESNKQISELIETLKSNLEKNGLNVIGEYMPADDKNRYIIVATNSDLQKQISKLSGIRGFAGAIRIAITKEKGKSKISYTNPFYWGRAYFQDDYKKLKNTIVSISKKLKKSLVVEGKKIFKEFGSENGLDEDELEEYHYMISMPYFEDVVELKKFSSHKSAIKKIEANIKKNKNTSKVYRIDYPNSKLTLYGIGLSGNTGENQFLPIIDIGSPKHTAFLPYELLVMDGKVVMLHGRFRIAVSFPDLGMVTFTKIMSTPGEIEDLMKNLTK